MIRVTLRVVALACLSPLSIYAMGLGDMRVSSSLNEPFRAEIALLGVKNGLPPSVQVEVATNEEYERIGLVRAVATNLLHLEITRNAKGKPIVEITSKDRMTEPFLDVLIDLSWPTGEVFKEYLILLDPPNYTLKGISNRIKANYTAYRYKNNSTTQLQQSGISQAVYASESPITQSSNKPLSYGPVVAGETIWQIAQHYKVGQVQLSQLVLAIVGNNPNAFTDGNLNGLITGSQLTIPTITAILTVPLALAPQEVEAHDQAWNNKQPIKHVIEPPYMVNKPESNTNLSKNTIESVYQKALSFVEGSDPNASELPKVPTLVKVTDNANWIPEETHQPPAPQGNAAENAATVAALEGLRASNILLSNQLNELRKQNKQFQEQMDKREKDMLELSNQVKMLTQRESGGAQVHAASVQKNNSDYAWLLWLLGLAAIGGGAFVFWRAHKPLPEIYQDTINKFHDLYNIRFKKTEKDSQAPVTPQTESSEAFNLDDLDSIEVNDKPDLLMQTKTIEPTNAIPNQEIEPQPTLDIESQPKETPLLPAETEPEPAETPEIPSQPQEIEPQPKEIPKPPVEIEPILKAESDLHLLEFETGLYTAPNNEPKITKELDSVADVNSEDFKLEWDESEEAMIKKESNTDVGLLKNKQALETLLDLAQTYVSMGDNAAAKQSLEEVIAFGDEMQKAKAEVLLKSIS